MEKDARLVRNVLLEFARDSFLPEAVFTVDGQNLVSQSDADKRYSAAASWFDEYKILVISNGPYMLTKFEPQSQYAELNAFRDSTYPFKPGDWYQGSAQLVEITDVDGDPIQVGEEAHYEISVTGPGEMGLKYILFDPIDGKVLDTGDGEIETSTELHIYIPPTVTSNMLIGSPYRLYLAAFSDEISYVTERVQNIDVGTITTTKTSTPDQTTTITQTTTATTEEGGGTSSPLLIVAAVVLLVLIVIPAVLLKRRGAKEAN